MCVARRSDNVVVAQRVHTPGRAANYFQNVKRVLDSPGWASVRDAACAVPLSCSACPRALVVIGVCMVMSASQSCRWRKHAFASREGAKKFSGFAVKPSVCARSRSVSGGWSCSVYIPPFVSARARAHVCPCRFLVWLDHVRQADAGRRGEHLLRAD